MRLAGALAYFWWVLGYLREGRRWLEQALALGPNVPSRFRARALVGAATLAASLGDQSAARGFIQHAFELAEALGGPDAATCALCRLSSVAMLESNPRDAQALLERSLALSRGVEDPPWQAHMLFQLAWARMLHGDLEGAEAALAKSLDLCRTLGNRRLAAAIMSDLARVKLTRGDDVAAAALVTAQRGNLEHAVQLLAAGEAWNESTGDVLVFGPRVREETEEITTRARDKMGESAYRAAVTEGRALSADEVVDMAQAGLEPHPGTHPERATTTDGARPRAVLSNREQAILRLIAEGLLNKQIATSLGIGERTVKTYLTSAMRKLGVDTRAHAAVAAVERGLLE